MGTRAGGTGAQAGGAGAQAGGAGAQAGWAGAQTGGAGAQAGGAGAQAGGPGVQAGGLEALLGGLGGLTGVLAGLGGLAGVGSGERRVLGGAAREGAGRVVGRGAASRSAGGAEGSHPGGPVRCSRVGGTSAGERGKVLSAAVAAGKLSPEEAKEWERVMEADDVAQRHMAPQERLSEAYLGGRSRRTNREAKLPQQHLESPQPQATINNKASEKHGAAAACQEQTAQHDRNLPGSSSGATHAAQTPSRRRLREESGAQDEEAGVNCSFRGSKHHKCMDSA
ncbi:unnamed protein product [Closterium sp. Yama58-4]|nr:unnamed protein product [Closterium sp. Yama58-4]